MILLSVLTETVVKRTSSQIILPWLIRHRKCSDKIILKFYPYYEVVIMLNYCWEVGCMKVLNVEMGCDIMCDDVNQLRPDCGECGGVLGVILDQFV